MKKIKAINKKLKKSYEVAKLSFAVLVFAFSIAIIDMASILPTITTIISGTYLSLYVWKQGWLDDEEDADVYSR